MSESLPIKQQIQLEPSWLKVLQAEFEQPYFFAIKQFLLQEKQAGHMVYPQGKLIFNAFEQTPFDEVKVVILGQDPYHGAGQAHGLSFSVPLGVPPPPSLVHIFKEIKQDMGIEPPTHGNLEAWARQGVFLLNAILTVRANTAASHQHIGWQDFTDAVIRRLSEQREGIVFMLWGKFAQNKKSLIDASKHYILQAAHPSPLSALSGFFGCKHFSKCNELLQAAGKHPIDWHL